MYRKRSLTEEQGSSRCPREKNKGKSVQLTYSVLIYHPAEVLVFFRGEYMTRIRADGSARRPAPQPMVVQSMEETRRVMVYIQVYKLENLVNCGNYDL